MSFFPTPRFLAESSDGESFGVHIAFIDLYYAVSFLAAIYVAGIAVQRVLGMPALVGEILTGILLGPSLLNIVPIPEAFVLLGEIG
jgi:Kef-type K+ transport system membrane component KefB